MASDEQTSYSSTMNDILPLDMLLEILYKLSVKELHRNKTVCKLWSSIISHPCFPSQYSVRTRKSSSSPSYTLYLNSYDCHNEKVWSIDSPIVSLDFLQNFVLGSSNGLLLCSYNTDDNPSKVTYYVVNPLTKKHLTLPSPPTSTKDDEDVVLSGIVVCCDSSSNYQTQFKVVRIVRDAYYRVSNVLDMEIFDSTTKQWRVLRTEIDSKISFQSGNAVEHRGILYWLLGRRDSILMFNPNHDDLCHRISLPVSNVRNLCIGLGLCQDHLYYVQINFHVIPNIPCTIWRCDEFNGEYIWTVCRSLDLDWINQQKIFNLDFIPFCELLLIDPMDYNILYLCDYRLYSIDLAKREMTVLCSAPAFKCLMLVEPTWPTSIPSQLLEEEEEENKEKEKE